MKKLLLFGILSLFNLESASGQTWQSLTYGQFANTKPYGQFAINRYKNDIWLVNDNKAAVIENSGVVETFDNTDFGPLWTGAHLRFCFTPDSIFYMKETFGLFNFNNYISSSIFPESSILEISANKDTVNIKKSGTLLLYIDGQIIDTYFSASDVILKNVYLYTDNGILGHKVGGTNQMLNSDPQYLLAPINDKKFQRFTDSIYVGMTKGIMYAYNYDILDTITPNNSTAMPSANVLEIEFDMNDNLWAVFGDASDIPFAIAKLEGSTWTNRIDNLNSPIDFSTFLGLEIDTMGNLWVADQSYLHTLLSPNSPQWLSLSENAKTPSVTISPNPVSDVLTVRGSGVIDEIQIMDLQGRIVQRLTPQSKNPQIALDKLSAGTYLLVVTSDAQIECIHFVKQ